MESLRSSYSALTAEVYEFAKPLARSYRDVAYYERVLKGTPGRVLELATGTGRFLIPLLEAGVDIEGLDHSPQMLALCRKFCRERGLDPVLHEADMAAFELPQVYQAIIIGAGAIKELPGREAVLRSLARCRAALVPGGRLFVDIVPPRLVSLASSRDRPTKPAPMRYWRRGRFMWTLQTVLLEYDSAKDRTMALRRYEKWRDGQLVATELHEFCMQHWTLEGFERLLVEAGFADITVVADYQDGDPPNPDNDDWTFHALRP